MTMRRLLPLLLLSVMFILVGCSGKKRTPSYNPNVGPFDEDGNYIEAWADNPPAQNKRFKPAAPQPAPRVVDLPKPRPTTPTVARVTSPKPQAKPQAKPVAKPQPKPKPKPVVVKPKTRYHTVAKGETLYSLARKYGTSVSAIQKANSLSGTTIRTGKSYVIPR